MPSLPVFHNLRAVYMHTCNDAQGTLHELAKQQVHLVLQHEQQEHQDQQQQQPAPDPNTRPSVFANRTSTDDVTRRLEQQTVALRGALQQHHGEVQRELVGRLGAQGRELPVAVALAVQQQMGRRDLVTGALLGAAVALVGERPAGAVSGGGWPISPEVSAPPRGAVGEGTALSGTGSSGSVPVAPGGGGVGPVKRKAAGDVAWAGRVFVPPRATTSNEVSQCSLNSVTCRLPPAFKDHAVCMRFTCGSVASNTAVIGSR